MALPDLRSVAFPVLHDDQVAALARCGAATLRRYPDGHVLFKAGDERSFIGAVPRTEWLPPEIEKDDKGFVRTGPGLDPSPHWTARRAPFLLKTSRPGVFAAGDVRAGSVKRVASAVGEGAMAVQLSTSTSRRRDVSSPMGGIKAIILRSGLSAILVSLLVSAAPVAAEEVAVYAAASLTDALEEVAQGFEAKTGHKVVFNVGASNDLVRQIKAGAPADVFFSADKAQMDGLEAAGLVRAADRVDVLSNALVVIVPASRTARISQPSELLAVKRLALADPEAVPAGVYARSWLESIGLWDKLEDKVIPTLNVRAALSAVESENADAGIVYRTDAAISKRVKVAFEVPRQEGPAIVYPLAPLAGSRKPATAELVRYLTSADAREVYRRCGFIVLGEK